MNTTPFHRRRVTKPDGRALWLYARRPISDDVVSSVADMGPYQPSGHMRWHPLRGEWVIYSGARQHRTFLPVAANNPLAPTQPGGPATELPRGDYDVAVFENRFPAFYESATERPVAIVPTAPANGACEVVVYSQDPRGALGRLPLAQIELLVEVWADRTRELAIRSDVAYVFVFENRGVEVGVTLHHPHGQIYAYPFVPPLVAIELGQQRAHLERTGRNLLERHIEAEVAEGRRIIYRGPHAVAFVPVCARYAYEIWVAPTRAVPSFAELAGAELRDFARALKVALAKLDGLWQRDMPYVMVFHQAPCDGEAHPEAHLHAQIYPPYRMPDRLKYLAGSELGAGTFAADTLPEQTAAELAAVEVDVA